MQLGLFTVPDERPLCHCHNLPMTRNGYQRGTRTQKWRCTETERGYTARRVSISIANQDVHVGYMPTAEAALELRRKIREEAPRGHA